MPVSKKYVGWFAGGAVCVLSAWVALIVVSVTTNVLVPSKSAVADVNNGPGQVGTGLAGPLAGHARKRDETAPTFTQLRLSLVSRRGLFAGRGEPSARVVLLKAGRAVADVRAGENGEWQIATALTGISGDHNFALEQRGGDGVFVAGESIRVHVPEAFRQTINVIGTPATRGFQLVAAQTDREDIGTASSRKFDELMRDGALDEKSDERVGVVAELSDDLLAPAWSWLRDANRSYLDEVVPRIKRGGGYGQGGAGEPVTRQPERDRTARRPPVRPREDDVRWSSETASWVPSGVTDWLAAAQRGYTTEIVPRLSGRVPAVIVARKPDEDANRETETETEAEAERRRRLERDRNVELSATEKAEQERLEAARQRRAAERRRREAEEEARRLAEARRQADLEEARKLAAERRRVLERRAEAKRLAEAAERERDKDTEEQRRLDRERELARAQEAAEREALERQRRADQERDNKVAATERERKRLAELDLRTREKEREAAEQRRLAEQERRDRLIAEAAAIKQRQEQARQRAREETAQREAARQLERRRAQEQRLAEQRREQERLAEQRREQQRLGERRAEERREQQRLAERRAEERRAEERRRRLTRTAELNREAARERRDAQRRRSLEVRPTLPTQRPQRIAQQRPQRVAQQRLRDLNRFKRRDTEIEINAVDDASNRAETANRRDERPRTKAKPKRRVASLRRANRTGTRRATKARRRAVRGYRRRLARANRKHSRCPRSAGRRVDPPGTYTVKRGDSLWRISKRHYRLGRYFRTIHRANRRKIRRARLIYPCQRFYLPRRRRS